MDQSDESYWDRSVYQKNSEDNIPKIKQSIDDLEFDFDKIMVCGRGSDRHPDFHPRFSTTSTDIDSDLYVLVDHDISSLRWIKREGNYALSTIVHPSVVEKIEALGGKIFWFSPEYFDCDLPKITAGKYPRGNSGLATISLAAYFGIKNILISGINFSEKRYEQFLDGKDFVFSNLLNDGVRLFSLDGILAEKIGFEEWRK